MGSVKQSGKKYIILKRGSVGMILLRLFKFNEAATQQLNVLVKQSQHGF